MSINSISIQRFPNEQNCVQEQVSRNYCTSSAKIQRYALYFFATASFLGSAALLIATIAGAITLPAMLCSVPLLVITGGCIIYYAKTQIIDYTNPQELQKTIQEASSMTLSQAVKKYGWGNIQQYSLLSNEQISIKFRAETRGMSFEQIYWSYDLRFVIPYLNPTERSSLQNLGMRFQQARDAYNSRTGSLSREFHQNTALSRTVCNAGIFVGHELLAHHHRRHQTHPCNQISRHSSMEVLGSGIEHAVNREHYQTRDRGFESARRTFQTAVDQINTEYETYRQQQENP